jgi:hypothetical protein
MRQARFRTWAGKRPVRTKFSKQFLFMINRKKVVKDTLFASLADRAFLSIPKVNGSGESPFFRLRDGEFTK